MPTKREPTVRELLEELRHDLRHGLADIRRRLDALEKLKVAKVVDPWSRTENGGGPAR
jgi:hypothetical protein